MGFSPLTVALQIIVLLVGIAATLLLTYGVIRAGVAAGLRDHVKWLEKKRLKENRSAASVYPPITPEAGTED
jgi:hypothetical protein